MKFSAAIVLSAVVCLASSASAVPTAPIKAGKYFNRVLTVVFENADYDDVMADPYFKSLGERNNGIALTQFFAQFHPSQPNYIAMITGGRDSVSNSKVNINKRNLVDLLEGGRVSWKSYQENYPGNCFVGDSSDRLYVRKHNPFISMNNVRTNPARCANIVGSAELAKDVAAGTAPQYIFYTPNMDNCGHDTSIGYSSKWAKGFLEPLLANTEFMNSTLVIITWDESENYFNDNQVATYLLGPMVDGAKSKTDNTKYSHYSILKTIEDNWSLGSLGRSDVSATTFARLKTNE
ncbi:hypothetical protein PhCBS80983_g02745 [Powellomyces hirtus]|uniref:Acid phosphatase n=1 Tax=Powellomyces hirtus TaxID=109895 RepID=A0A507E4T8_9FUNG|nr:hypothetical protein PhCBS80983_g02745 [Powellomyces hirtus]